jgi:hypothetical protein
VEISWELWRRNNFDIQRCLCRANTLVGFGTMLFGPGFPSRDSRCIFARRTSSGSEFQAAIRGLVLLPKKIARKVWVVLIVTPCLEGRSHRLVQLIPG